MRLVLSWEQTLHCLLQGYPSLVMLAQSTILEQAMLAKVVLGSTIISKVHMVTFLKNLMTPTFIKTRWAQVAEERTSEEGVSLLSELTKVKSVAELWLMVIQSLLARKLKTMRLEVEGIFTLTAKLHENSSQDN